jgi:hypothetical protein
MEWINLAQKRQLGCLRQGNGPNEPLPSEGGFCTTQLHGNYTP